MAEGLLAGIDPEQLKQLMAQFGATDQDRADAKRQAALTFGLLALQGRKGSELAALGQAGIGGLAAKNQYLNDTLKQRIETIGPAMQIQAANRSAQFVDAMMKGAQSGPASINPTADVSHLPSLFNAQIPSGVSGVLNDPSGALPNISTTPALPKITQAPAAAQSGPPPGPSRAELEYYGVPSGRIAAIASSANPQAEYSKAIDEYSKPFMVQGMTPTVRAAGGTLRAVVPEGANAALAAQTAAQKEAELSTGAKYNIINQPTMLPGGGQGPTVPMTQAQLLQQVSGSGPRQGLPQLPENGPPVNLNFKNARPSDVNVALRELAQNGGGQGGGGFGAFTLGSAPPQVTHQATSSIDTQQGLRRAANEDFIKGSYRPVVDNIKASKQANVGLDVLDKLDITNKSGWGTEQKALAARVLEGFGMAPEFAKHYATDSIIFNQQLGKNVWELLGAQKGVQSEGDAARAKKTFANLENTPDANRFQLAMARAINNLNIKQGEFYAKNYDAAVESGNVSKLEADWAQKAPSLWDDPALAKWKNAGEAGAPSQDHPADIRAIMKKYGAR